MKLWNVLFNFRDELPLMIASKDCSVAFTAIMQNQNKFTV